MEEPAEEVSEEVQKYSTLASRMNLPEGASIFRDGGYKLATLFVDILQAVSLIKRLKSGYNRLTRVPFGSEAYIREATSVLRYCYIDDEVAFLEHCFNTRDWTTRFGVRKLSNIRALAEKLESDTEPRYLSRNISVQILAVTKSDIARRNLNGEKYVLAMVERISTCDLGQRLYEIVLYKFTENFETLVGRSRARQRLACSRSLDANSKEKFIKESQSLVLLLRCILENLKIEEALAQFYNVDKW